MPAALRDLLRRADSPLAPLVVTAVALAAFLALQLASVGGDATRFVVLGEKYADPSGLPVRIAIAPGGGYDGQFYFRLALDPFTSERSAFGVTLDAPAWRQQRIVYPLVVWLFAGGSPERVVPLLIAVNSVALLALAFVAGLIARTAGRHALWGTLFAFYPGFLVTVSRDLTEILEACAVLAALLLLRRGMWLFAALALTLAAFTKETSLGLAAAVLAIGLARREARALLFLVPIAAQLAWQVTLARVWGQLPTQQGSGSLEPPFVGLVRAFGASARYPPAEQLLWLALLSFALVALAAAGASLARSSAPAHEKLAWLGYLGLAVLFEGNIWSNGAGFLRALTDSAMLGGPIALNAGGPARATLLGATLAAWLLLVAVRVAV